MEVYFQGKKKEYLNTIEQVDIIFEDVRKILEVEDRIMNSLRIDNIEIYANFKESVLERLSGIDSIEIVALTLKEMADETMESIELYLSRALVELKVLIDDFYQGSNVEAWARFSEFLGGIEWVLAAVQGIKEINVHYTRDDLISEHSARLKAHLLQLTESLENQDVTLTADILNFEVVPTLEKLVEDVQLIISSEVVPHGH